MLLGSRGPHRVLGWWNCSLYDTGVVDIWPYAFVRTHATTPGCPGGSDGKESAFNAEDPGSVPGLRRPPGEGNGNPLEYSGLENSMDREAWQATVHGIAKSWTRLRDFQIHTYDYTTKSEINSYAIFTKNRPGYQRISGWLEDCKKGINGRHNFTAVDGGKELI